MGTSLITRKSPAHSNGIKRENIIMKKLVELECCDICELVLDEYHTTSHTCPLCTRQICDSCFSRIIFKDIFRIVACAVCKTVLENGNINAAFMNLVEVWKTISISKNIKPDLVMRKPQETL